jgi:hypothetical protein
MAHNSKDNNVSIHDLDEVQSLLDALSFVSVKYYAQHMQMHTLKARQVMNAFKAKHPHKAVSSYLVSGFCKDDTASNDADKGLDDSCPGVVMKSYSIATEDQLEEEKSKYEDNGKVSLYGLQSLIPAHKDTTATQYYVQDLEQTNELLARQMSVHNELGSIKYSKLAVASEGSKQRNLMIQSAAATSSSSASSFKDASKVIPPVAAAKSVSAEVKMPAKPAAAVTNFFTKQASAPAMSSGSSTFAAASSSSSSSSTAAAKKVKSEPSFFAAQEKKDKPVAIEPVIAVTAPTVTTPGATTSESEDSETPATAPRADDDEDDEELWDDGSGKAFKPDKKKVIRQREEDERLQSRKRLNINDENDGDGVNSGDDHKMTVDNDAEDSANNNHGGGKFRKHGAMDDFLEDAAIAREKQRADEHADGSPAAKTKNKRRKLVEKVPFNLIS